MVPVLYLRNDSISEGKDRVVELDEDIGLALDLTKPIFSMDGAVFEMLDQDS
jgi:hypothetical protein